MQIADQLIASFGRIAAADGGHLEALSESETVVRMGYRSGAPADCADGICALPHAEIEAMMLAWLARKAPQIRLEVELLQS